MEQGSFKQFQGGFQTILPKRMFLEEGWFYLQLANNHFKNQTECLNPSMRPYFMPLANLYLN